MADASYDAVIIGGGHNALITGCYLALNGLSVAVFEREDELGGGTMDDKSAMPGFNIQPMGVMSRIWGSPVYSDQKPF
jgi:phytoene dehydrogenase-like protein